MPFASVWSANFTSCGLVAEVPLGLALSVPCLRRNEADEVDRFAVQRDGVAVDHPNVRPRADPFPPARLRLCRDRTSASALPGWSRRGSSSPAGAGVRA